MADATTVVEGKVKYREGRKWKSRWCVLKKPSPVADRLQLVLYKDVHEALRAGGKVKTSFSLDGYCGLESGFAVEREENVLAILCHKQITLLAFESRDYLIQFEVKIRSALGQDYQYPVRLVKAPSGTRLPLDESVKLLIHGVQFCVTAQTPPRILQCWNIADLRRYGVVDGKFCFDGGTRCGKGAGVHAMQTDQADEISEILRVNSLGKPSRAAGYRRVRLPPSATLEPPPPLPGLSPTLPADFTAQLSPQLGSKAPNLFHLHYSTPLTVSVESLEGSDEELAERLSLSSQGSYQNLRSMDHSIICSSPAFTVLRPRWGVDYQVVDRRRAGLESTFSTPVTQSPTYSNVFTYEVTSLWTKRSPTSISVSSGQSGEREPSTSHGRLTLPSTSSASRESGEREPSPGHPRLTLPSASSVSRESGDREVSPTRARLIIPSTSSACRENGEREPSPSHARLVLPSTSSVSKENGEREPSPISASLTQPSALSVSRDRTPSEPLSLPEEPACSLETCTSSESPPPLPPRTNRMCLRANSELRSSQNESPSVVSHSVSVSSPPTSPRVPNSSILLSPELLQPMLNYAEIDLSAATSPPPVKMTRQFSWRQKRPPPKLVPVAYTQIDHTATSALKRAGREHALSREDYSSLRRGATILNLARKNSAPIFKERKGSSSFSREKTFSTCSMESI